MKTFTKKTYWLILVKSCLYLICVLVTVGLVMLVVDYLTGILFGMNFIEDNLSRACRGRNSEVCVLYKVVFKTLNSLYWPLIVLAVVGAFWGANRIEKKNK